MAETKITQSPTFCSAPWTGVNIDQTGSVFPCMQSGYVLGNIKEENISNIINGPAHQDLKQTMVNGQWHNACAICQQSEKTTGQSTRTAQRVSDATRDNIDNDVNWFSLQHITVNWSNLCNLTCVYCNPQTSTAWQSIKGIPINHVKNEHPDLIELAKQKGHEVLGLTLGGGEPLLQKGLLEFLKYLNPNQCRVLVTTNLSIDISKNEIYQELKNWPHVNWQVSFDNADKDKFEYVRDRASWDQFVANLKLMKQDQQAIFAHPAYSIYCALDLVDYYKFCIDYGLNLFWCDLQHPWDLDVRRYPEQIRKLAIQEIDRVVELYGDAQRDIAVDTLMRYRKTLLDNSYLFDPEYRVDPVMFHTKIEAELKKSKTFNELWPEYAIL